MNHEVIDQWNRAAALYAAEQETSEFVRVNFEAIRQRYPSADGLRVLDLGCGPGGYTDYFRTAGADAVGLDGSAEMLRIAREKYPLCTFMERDLMQPLPFADGEFDLVLCNQVLMDVDPIGPIVREVSRVLKKGGLFFMGVVHPAFYDCHWGKDENGFRRYKIMEKYLSDYHFDNEFWGSTRHYHRPLSFYLNSILSCGLSLTHMNEPVSYDGVSKSQEFPLFLLAEFRKLSACE